MSEQMALARTSSRSNMFWILSSPFSFHLHFFSRLSAAPTHARRSSCLFGCQDEGIFGTEMQFAHTRLIMYYRQINCLLTREYGRILFICQLPRTISVFFIRAQIALLDSCIPR